MGHDQNDDDVEMGNVGLLFLMMFLLAPINALVISTVCTKIWTMLIEPSLGEGPQPAAWYGISVLISIFTYYKGSTDLKTEKKLKQHPIVGSITVNLGHWVTMVFALLTSALSARILGWT